MKDLQVHEKFLPSIKASLNPDVLQLIIMPTEKCNFRCKYCYEDFALGRMTRTTIEAIVRLIEERSKDLRLLIISWFGGEPLIAQDIVLEISRRAQKICEENEIIFRSNATTNGYTLDLPLLEDLLDAGVYSYQITLDGTGEAHDQTRVLGSGAGTYERIMANLLAARASELNFRITLRLHITSANIDEMVDAAAWLKAQFGVDDRFTFLIKPIGDLGGPRTVIDTIADNNAASDVSQKMQTLLELNNDHPENNHFEVCYASRPNSFVIRSNGQVGKCTVVFNSPSNNLGKLENDGKLNIDVDKLRLWMSGYDTLDESALHCPVEALKLWN